MKCKITQNLVHYARDSYIPQKQTRIWDHMPSLPNTVCVKNRGRRKKLHTYVFEGVRNRTGSPYRRKLETHTFVAKPSQNGKIGVF